MLTREQDHEDDVGEGGDDAGHGAAASSRRLVDRLRRVAEIGNNSQKRCPFGQPCTQYAEECEEHRHLEQEGETAAQGD